MRCTRPDIPYTKALGGATCLSVASLMVDLFTPRAPKGAAEFILVCHFALIVSLAGLTILARSEQADTVVYFITFGAAAASYGVIMGAAPLEAAADVVLTVLSMILGCYGAAGAYRMADVDRVVPAALDESTTAAV